jgi:hypothetical protein
MPRFSTGRSHWPTYQSNGQLHGRSLPYGCPVDCGLLVAAGGGGDAIAAAILHRALDPSAARPAIATYSWDRLLIDPLPGPRDPSSFTGLERVGEHNYRVTPDSTVQAPAGSTLPRLAAELDADLFLLDPRRGAAGLAGQLGELVSSLHAARVTIVDVGGDILAHGDEPTLRSPLADSLVLAATDSLDHVQALVTGAGIDGELPENLVRERYDELDAQLVHQLSEPEVESFRPLFDWHPSEATGLLCAAAAGTRGTAEIRDQGLAVTLSDHTAEVHSLPAHRIVKINQLAQRLHHTDSLEAAETALRVSGRGSEIDYERRKASNRSHPTALTAAPSAAALLEQLAEIRRDAARRGIDFITLRGLAERLGLQGTRLGDLHRHLSSRPQGEYAPPLWKVRPQP